MKQIKTESFIKTFQLKKDLIIIRGLPSSGKSYLANQIAGEVGQVFSADDYHINPRNGEYEWKPENVKAAHQWNHKRVEKALEKGISPIVIDNTHTTMWELKQIKPLILKAKELGYNVRIEEPNPNWYHWETAFDPEALYERNKKTHKVPLESIQKMKDRWSPEITIEDILSDEET
jgi:NEDD4-binding protein 2